VTCLVCLFVALTAIGNVSRVMHKTFISVVQGNGTCTWVSWGWQKFLSKHVL